MLNVSTAVYILRNNDQSMVDKLCMILGDKRDVFNVLNRHDAISSVGSSKSNAQYIRLSYMFLNIAIISIISPKIMEIANDR